MFCGIKAGVDYLFKEDGAQKRKDNYSTVPSCAYKKCKQQLFKLSNAQKIPFWFAPSSSSPPPPPPLPEHSGVQGPHLYTPANRELVFKINRLFRVFMFFRITTSIIAPRTQSLSPCQGFPYTVRICRASFS